MLAAALVLPACGGGLFMGLYDGRPEHERERIVRRAGPADGPAGDEVHDDVEGGWRAAADVPHVSVFYDALAPYGVWEEDPALGWVWSPSDATFVPYARGRWVETEAGPTFLAEEPWGWAAAHYGRWVFRERWSWVPDVRWGPAWVSWRVSDEHVGWRALPPAGWTRPLPDAAWRFVPARELIGPSVSTRAYGLRDVPWLVATSRPHIEEAPAEGFVVGPRFAGWRAQKIALGRLPPGEVRWVPRWQRPELRRGRPSIRVGPDAAERPRRKAIAVPR